ncbi:O-antigen ligase family protein [Flavobacterium sp.]|uniref:O-antigen ligase family protein n=1 Tax=Flavobacterium sp. TaxID=239 RepID=UPI003528DD43
MNSIYYILKNVWIKGKNAQQENVFFLPLLLLLLTIALPLGVNNVALMVVVLSVFLQYKKLSYNFNISFVFPVLLFLWMALSYFWSIDKERTLQAIPKELILFLLPLIYLFLPRFKEKTKQFFITCYSYSIVALVLFFLIRAIVRYLLTGDTRAFFYHGEYDDDYGLVPKLLNAIHVSVYVSLAFFNFFIKKTKSKLDYVIIALLFVFVLLLSSKNIIVVFVLLTLIYVFFYSKTANRMRLRNVFVIVATIGIILSFSRIKDRFLLEFQSNTDKGLSHNITTIKTDGVHVVSIYEAWNNEVFQHGDYFPGTAFRVYQTRMFFEFLKEEPIFWQGFGLNASLTKLIEKEKKYNLYPGYGTFNFHNQYIQNFAELGFVGFLLLLLLLGVSFYKAFKLRDFMHISFTILMISLFLTESFLWRQRGVVFFTVFYCLFMMQLKPNKNK